MKKARKILAIDKGYRCFFAFLMLAAMVLSSVRVEISFSNNLPEIKSFSIQKIPQASAIAHLAIIAYLLGVPTDSIALKIARMLHPEEEDEDDQED